MRRIPSTALIAMSLLVAACGGGTSGASTTTSPLDTTTAPPSTTTTTEPMTTSTSAPATTTSVGATTTTPGSAGTTWAGQEIVYGPAEGDVLMVIGVRYDDVLNLRAGPGATRPIRDRIPPTYTQLIASGSAWELPSSLWIEVDYDGSEGWVNLSYIGYEGDVVDETADVISELGETPTAPTMPALGELVAGVFSSEDLFSDIVQVTEATSGDLSEVTYDVVGLGDDSVRGARLHVFAEEGSGGFTLKTVEMTIICGRGVDSDRRCV